MSESGEPSRGEHGLPDPGDVTTSWATTALFRKVAHDIVGTAGVARGAIEELSRAAGGDGAPPSTMFDLARRSLARLDRLARRLRLAALAQEGPLVTARVSADVDALIETAVADASTLDARKAVSLERLPLATKLVVEADRDLLAGALGELVSNALRFARKRVRVSAERVGDAVVIAVDDDGPGWPAGFAEAMFPILRDRPGQRGSGVSLPVVAVVAREHGGSLVLGESALTDAQGRPGARASLHLPC